MLLTGSASNDTLSGLLSSATEVLTWFITSMGSLLTFVISHPVILMMFLILLSGSVVGMLFRIWHSAWCSCGPWGNQRCPRRTAILWGIFMFKEIVTYLLNVFYDFAISEYMLVLVFAIMIGYAWIMLWRLILWRK